MVTEMPRGPDLHQRDHPGPRGQPDEEGQRAGRLHPHRRDGPGQRPATPAGQAHPRRPARPGCRPPKTAARASSCSSTRTPSPPGSSAILASPLWEAHREAHRRNFQRRFSETAKLVDPDTRLPPPRYWLLHTLAHVLIREMAMSCGYGAASLSERLYALAGRRRPRGRGRPADLHHRVRQRRHPRRSGRSSANPTRLQGWSISRTAPGGALLLRPGLRDAHAAATRRTSCTAPPATAAAFASETSCERANRFLDRRFLLNLPDRATTSSVPGSSAPSMP